MGMGVNFKYSMGMAVIFEKGYGYRYNSTHPKPAHFHPEPTDQEGTKEVTKVTKEVKEDHTLVRNITNTCLDFLPGSTMHNPVFVRLITNDSGGVSANLAHDLLA